VAAAVAAAALAAFALACGGDDDDGAPRPDAGPDAAPDAASDAAPDGPPPCEPSELSPRSPEIFEAIVAHLLERETHDQGNWDLDYGDATAYAPPVLTAVGRARCDPAIEALAAVTIEWEQELVRSFARELSGEGLIGALGVIETFARTGDPALADLAADAVGYSAGVIDLFGGVLPAETVAGAGLPYGQTAATGLLVAIELRYVELVDPADEARLASALAHAQQIEEAMWAEELGFYRFNEGDDELHVYAQSAMMAVHALAGRLTGDVAHLDRAEALFDAIAPAYRPEIGAYHDAYQGTGEDYVSLSTTSYLLLALHLVSRERPDARYDDAIDELVAFIEERLWAPDESVAYHHWEYGQRADWYCTGCNFQLGHLLLLLGGEGG
jgi:hypothetical protein